MVATEEGWHDESEKGRERSAGNTKAEIKGPSTVSFRTTFVFGFLVTSALAMIMYVSLAHLFGNMLIGWIGAIAVCAYFGIEGMVEIPVAHKAVPLIFGERVSWFLLGEGRQWILPPFFMDIKTVDVRTRGKQIPLAKVLSKDNVSLTVTVSLAFRIKNPLLWTQLEGGEELLGSLTERTIRWSVNESMAVELPMKTKDLSQNLETVLDEGTAEWGIDIEKAIVEGVDLPEDIKKANAQKEVEKSEKEAETTEMRHLSDRAKELKKDFPGLTDIEVFNIVQSERGKIKRTVVDGNASSLEKAASLVGRDTKGGL